MIYALQLTMLISATLALHSNNFANMKEAHLFRVTPKENAHLEYLLKIFKSETADFWTLPTMLEKPVDIMSIGWMAPVMQNGFKHENIEYEVIFNDIEELIKLSKIQNEEALAASREKGSLMDWTAYHPYEDIETWLESLPSKFPSLVTVEDAGLSFEGRKIKVVKISSSTTVKPIIWVDAGMYGREWIAPSTAMYIINELLFNAISYSAALNAVDFYFMPLVNPDGYAYSWSNERLWSKTRYDAKLKSGCIGVDPNRNWDFHWNEVENVSNPCADKYPGPNPFSEIEMVAVRDQLLKVAENVKVYLSFQSYGQTWLSPWSYSKDLTEDSDDLDLLAEGAVDALTSTNRTKYDYGSSLNTFLCSTGTSADWAKGVAGIKYAYTVELPDAGEYGFFLPPDRIAGVGKETVSAFKFLINFVEKTYVVNNHDDDSNNKEEL